MTGAAGTQRRRVDEMTEKYLEEQLSALRANCDSGALHQVAHRVARLRELLARIRASQREVLTALYNDLGKAEAEAMFSEWLPVMETLKYFIRRTRSLARPRRVCPSCFNWPASGRIIPEPRGVVLIVSTWNYPFSLALEPVIGAIAAGNGVVLKLSPTAQSTALVVTRILKAVFPANELAIANAELPELLNLRFDAIFFTGGGETGKLVAQAAARTLTPVTLELGGKSPCIVDETADIGWSAKRIVWGKFLNAGQSCVAPDFLLVQKSVKDKLMIAIRQSIREFYGDNPQESRDYGRIINKFHFDRLAAMLSEGRLIAGGESSPEDFYIAPTVIDNVELESALMRDEIFGPILPVIEFDTLGDALVIVNRRPRPLALYYFGRSRRNRNRILRQTSSGGVNINDTVTHMLNRSMPFGGVGASGMGAYHGRWSFETFSHLKPVQRRWRFPEIPLRFPPFRHWKLTVARFFTK